MNETKRNETDEGRKSVLGNKCFLLLIRINQSIHKGKVSGYSCPFSCWAKISRVEYRVSLEGLEKKKKKKKKRTLLNSKFKTQSLLF